MPSSVKLGSRPSRLDDFVVFGRSELMGGDQSGVIWLMLMLEARLPARTRGLENRQPVGAAHQRIGKRVPDAASCP